MVSLSVLGAGTRHHPTCPGRNGASTTVQTSPLSDLQRKRFQEIVEKDGNLGLSEWFSLRTIGDRDQEGPSKKTDGDRPRFSVKSH